MIDNLSNEDRAAYLDDILASTPFRDSSSTMVTLRRLFASERGVSIQELANDEIVRGVSPRVAYAQLRRAVARIRDDLDYFYKNHYRGRKSLIRSWVVSDSKGGRFRVAFGVNLEMSIPKLRLFICHSSGDKTAVRKLNKRLREDGFSPWLDEENLLPGQDWEIEIKRAVRECEIVLVCLSVSSVTKQGFVQKEIKTALDVAEEKPEGAIYIIPVRLEKCLVPERLAKWQWVDLFETLGYSRLVNSLRVIRK